MAISGLRESKVGMRLKTRHETNRAPNDVWSTTCRDPTVQTVQSGTRNLLAKDIRRTVGFLGFTRDIHRRKEICVSQGLLSVSNLFNGVPWKFH